MLGAPDRATAVRTWVDDCETASNAPSTRPVEHGLRPMNGLLALTERPAGVMAVTTVHALLSRISQSTQLCFGQYLRDLCDDLAGTFGQSAGHQLTCAAADVTLSIRAGITLGLIADLLITNALVYGFPPERSGRIAVSFTAGLDDWQLTVEDNGTPMPASGDRRDNGLMIARLLVLRLDARLEMRRVNGETRCVVTPPRPVEAWPERVAALPPG